MRSTEIDIARPESPTLFSYNHGASRETDVSKPTEHHVFLHGHGKLIDGEFTLPENTYFVAYGAPGNYIDQGAIDNLYHTLAQSPKLPSVTEFAHTDLSPIFTITDVKTRAQEEEYQQSTPMHPTVYGPGDTVPFIYIITSFAADKNWGATAKIALDQLKRDQINLNWRTATHVSAGNGVSYEATASDLI